MISRAMYKGTIHVVILDIKVLFPPVPIGLLRYLVIYANAVTGVIGTDEDLANFTII